MKSIDELKLTYAYYRLSINKNSGTTFFFANTLGLLEDPLLIMLGNLWYF